MVDDQVDEQPDSALPASMGEFDEIAQRSVARVDGDV
jgi:hypothetical protein